LEANSLKLSTEHFPISCSLHDAVQKKYAEAASAAMNEQSMSLEEVLGYLRGIDDFRLGPMDAIRAQTDAMGDPSLPTPAQVAILEWLQQSCDLWTENFPVEQPLAAQLRRLFPVAAALAITDANFFIAGAHPLHTLLDTIQASAIGWQPQLGRAGKGLEQLVEKATNEIQTWFQGQGGELAASCSEIVKAIDKDLDRAKRMAERLADTEKGRLRTASARWKAAEMINRSLTNRKATAEVGEFLQGPWYESAQLVLLKFGADSKEWAQMSETTINLLDSLQIDGASDDRMRQHLFEVVTRIPKEIKRWLLSLHMDIDAVNDAIGVIEHAHFQLLKQQPIELQAIRPLHMEGMTADRTAGADLETIQSLRLGQWFAINEGGETQRAQLILKLSQEQQLQFANKAGMKAKQHSYENFCKLLSSGKARPLHNGASFSRCLVFAAGIETVEELQALPPATVAPRQDQASDQGQQEAGESSQPKKNAEHLEAERIEKEKFEAEQLRRQHEEAERILLERQEAARLEKEQQETQRQQQEAQRVLQEQQREERIRQQREAERALREQQEEERALKERLKADADLKEQEEAERVFREQIEAERALKERQAAEDAHKAAEETALDQRARLEAERAQHEQRIAQQSEEETDAGTLDYEPPSGMGELNADEEEIEIPMGTWLGFHDGDTPMMAKLAVHDTDQDSFIFVNREGIKLRALNKRELFGLINNNLIEILEMRSDFREQVTRAKENRDY